MTDTLEARQVMDYIDEAYKILGFDTKLQNTDKKWLIRNNPVVIEVAKMLQREVNDFTKRLKNNV